MGKFARSARGSIVDFDLLEIKNTLNSVPQPISVDQRRQFINDKDGISAKKAQITGTVASEAMQLALQAAEIADTDEDAEEVVSGDKSEE